MTGSNNNFCRAGASDAKPCGKKSGSGTFFRAAKRYGHNEGLSCCFRQWRAEHSHCRFLHGYALASTFVFIARELDQHGWCIDFGGLKQIRQWLHDNFDHRLVASQDDPELERLKALDSAGLCRLKILPAVGCEAFACYTWHHTDQLARTLTDGRVRVESVEVQEHEGNSALYCNRDVFADDNAIA
jgi:6-pyruvoyltetrahydropterin/6-carboxytetrahydropterin synthase